MESESGVEAQIRQQLDRFDSAVSAPLRTRIPGTRAELERAQAQLGYPLPAELAALYRIGREGDAFLFELIAPDSLRAASSELEGNIREHKEFFVPDGAGLGKPPAGQVLPFARRGSLLLCVNLDAPNSGELLIADPAYNWEPGAFWEWAAPSILAWAEASAELAQLGLVVLLAPEYWPAGQPRTVPAEETQVHSTCVSHEVLTVLRAAGVGSGILGLGSRDPNCPCDPCVRYPKS